MTINQELANESAMMYAGPLERLMDKTLFVENLGILLSQTRENVAGCTLLNNETLEITFQYPDRSIYREKVNIACDSYAAIIKDTMKHI